MLSDAAQQYVLKLSRATLHMYLQHTRVIDKPRTYPPELSQQYNVLVELKKKVPGTGTMEIRGQAGELNTGKSLIDAVVNAVVSAVNDRKYAPLKLDEFPVTEIEVSLFDKYEDITSPNPREYINKINLGVDGLILNKGMRAGVIMPKIPIERKWTVAESLENLCERAGIDRNSWTDPSTRIFKFRPQVLRG